MGREKGRSQKLPGNPNFASSLPSVILLFSMKLLLPLLIVVAATAEHLRGGWLEVQDIHIADNGRACANQATLAPKIVTEEKKNEEMKSVPYEIKWSQEKKEIPAIVKKIIALAMITSSIPLASWIFRTIVTAVQGFKSDLTRIDDYTSLERAIVSLVYGFYLGAYGFPAVFRLARGESEGYGVVIHFLSLLAISWNLAEALNLWSLINGSSDNRWQPKGIWLDGISDILTLGGGCCLFGAILLIADKAKFAVQWSSLGALDSGYSMASLMIIIIVTLGLIAACTNFHAAFSYQRDEVRAFVAAKIKDADHKEQVDQLLRTRWFAPWVSVFTAAGFVCNIAALDAQDDETALASLFVTIIGGAVSGLSVVYSLRILTAIWRAIKKLALKLVALFSGRAAN